MANFDPGNVIVVRSSSDFRLQKYEGCWGQIRQVSSDSCSIAIGTNIFSKVEYQDIELLPDADQSKAYQYTGTMLKLKFTEVPVKELQHLLRQVIENSDGVKNSTASKPKT